MAKKNYIIDTSVYLSDYTAIYKFENNDVIIPLKVLEEIDNHKKRQDSVGSNARNIIRILDNLRKKGNLQKGVRIGEGKGIVKVARYEQSESVNFPTDLDLAHPDHIIIATALSVKQLAPRRKVIVVSRDINMRVICDSIGLESEDYSSARVITNGEQLYNGYYVHLVDDQSIDQFYNGEELYIEEEDIPENVTLYPNQYLLLVSNANEKKTTLARFTNHHEPLKKIIHDKLTDWRINARNKEQAFSIDLLMDPDVKIITLVGRAGSGKTLCAIAAGLQQTVGQDSIYKKLIVSRPVQPMGKDIGFLPGTLEEKMMPWVAPIQDNLEFLMGNDKTAMEMYIKNGVIELEALTYIRGRSISNAYIIVDEAQNLTMHEIKTIVTRVGENTKIILTGDIEQIDNVYVDQTSNGLTHAVEKFKPFPLAGHVTMRKGERSQVATLAAKVL
tara:strand:+ start:1039 stop:2373 length:1335 start_codon:yes stop_codon:yes gene_type:complete